MPPGIIPVFVPHLGCPNDCVFCNQRQISGVLEPVTADDVTAAIELSLSLNAGRRGMELAFYGGSFTAIPASEQEALLSAGLPFLRSGALGSVRVSTRPDAVDSEALARLRRFGVETIELGAQSMRDEVLSKSGRGHSSDDTRRAAALIRSAGFRLVLQMMTGLPGDDDEGAVYTALELIALRPSAVRVYPTVIIRDTPLRERWLRGEYSEHSVEDAVRVGARVLPLFEAAGIPVIRYGLNPTEDLSGGAAVAGAYHPALGELVRARVFRNRAEERLLQLELAPGKRAELGVHPTKVSQMIGQKRENIGYLTERFGLSELRVSPEPSIAETEVLVLRY